MLLRVPLCHREHVDRVRLVTGRDATGVVLLDEGRAVGRVAVLVDGRTAEDLRVEERVGARQRLRGVLLDHARRAADLVPVAGERCARGRVTRVDVLQLRRGQVGHAVRVARELHPGEGVETVRPERQAGRVARPRATRRTRVVDAPVRVVHERGDAGARAVRRRGRPVVGRAPALRVARDRERATGERCGQHRRDLDHLVQRLRGVVHVRCALGRGRRRGALGHVGAGHGPVDGVGAGTRHDRLVRDAAGGERAEAPEQDDREWDHGFHFQQVACLLVVTAGIPSVYLHQ